jgi:serine/threonine-protein kinase SRPK3
VVLKKLGWGHFSTVWLAFSLFDKKLYALKILKSNKKYLDSAFDEEEICKIIAENYLSSTWTKSVKQYFTQTLRKEPSEIVINRETTHCIQMYDWFFHHGPNGKHFVMAFEVLGKNLLSLVKAYDYHGIPMPIVREITRQLLMSLDYMHRICGLIHTDLKPENITFALKEGEEFDLMYKHVFSTPLIDMYEREEKIILNKKQAKNQKKKDRLKKKKNAAKQGAPSTTVAATVEDEDGNEEEEESKQEETATVPKSKAA